MNLFFSSIQRLVDRGFMAIVSSAALCLQRAVLKAVPTGVIPSAIASVHLRSEVAGGDGSHPGNIARTIHPYLTSGIIFLALILLSAQASALVITNTASVSSGSVIVSSSAFVLTPGGTPSTVEFLRYSSGATSTTIPAARYDDNGSGIWLTTSPITDFNGTPLVLPGVVDLLTAANYLAGEPIFIRLTDLDQNNDPLVAETVQVTVNSVNTGDSIVLELTESGPNSGVFIGAVQSTATPTAVNDRLLSVGSGSETLTVGYVDTIDPIDTSNSSVSILPPTAGMYLSKKTTKTSVAAGDFLQYSLSLTNNSFTDLAGTVITDILPDGFRYQPGTTTLDGLAVPDPGIGVNGRTMTFNVGAITTGTTSDLRYVTTITTGAKTGLAINIASATANGGISSNQAQAHVRIKSDLMNAKGHIAGRILYGNCEPGAPDRGGFSLRLQSTADRDQVEYQVTLKVEKVSVQDVNLIVNLPEVLEYVSGSTASGDIKFNEPVVDGSRLQFAVGSLAGNLASVITFKTRARMNVYGEFTTRAFAEFKTESSLETLGNIALRTPVATNLVKDYSRVIRPRFETLSAELQDFDKNELDGMTANLKGQDIKRIYLVGHADVRPIRGRSRTIFADNDILSQARAESVARYLQQSLNLKKGQIEIQGQGTNEQVYYSEWLVGTRLKDEEQWQHNRRVEVLVELENQSMQTRFLIPKPDSGEKTVRTEGLPGELSSAGLGLDADGIPNVRLYMEDGRFVDTDDKGLYHFEGLNPGSHVVQVDIDSLPGHLEAYQCEDNTRFASSPYSRFVDIQGGSLWRTDFFVRHRAPVSESGEVSLQLKSKLVDGNINFTVLITGRHIALDKRSLAIVLPDELEFLAGSAILNGNNVADPMPVDDELVENLGPASNKAWKETLEFKTRLAGNFEGEYPTLVTLRISTLDGNTHNTRVVENTVLSQARTDKNMLFKALYNKDQTKLSERDDQQLRGVIDYLRGKSIRRIEIIGHTDDSPLGPDQPDNYELSRLRAEYVGRILAETLGLHTQQISISGIGPDQPVADNNTTGGRLLNRRLEIYVTTGDDKLPAMVRIAGGDSGRTTNEIVARMPFPEESSPAASESTEPDLEGILSLTEGQRIATPIQAVRISLNSRLRPELLLDGQKIAADRIGFSMVQENGKTIYSYIGVNLGEEGSHVISLQGIGPFGNARFKQDISYVRTGEIADIQIIETSGNIADGKTPVKIKVRLSDRNGDQINSEAFLRIIDGDLQPEEPNNSRPEVRQNERTVKVDRQGIVTFAPVTMSGSHSATLEYNDLNITVQTYVQPVYRNWIMIGLAEGTAGYNELSGNLQSLTAADVADGYYDDGRLAFFAKGKVLGSYLMTASFDSEKERDDDESGLFGTIDPDKYYTLYGDTTDVRYDAASKEKLYLKLESDHFYAMFGDYNTGLTVTELSRYSRSLTGIKAEYQGKVVGVTAFAAETDNNFVKDEISGDGTSGLYHLSNSGILLNSEKITLETRDRFHSETVLESQQLNRYIDYTFDPVAGTIYFREPIYSRDSSFNPIYIVAEYETASAINREINGGGRISLKVSENGPELGVTMISEGTTGAEAELQGVDLNYKINQSTSLKAEAASTSIDTGGGGEITGNAYLAEITHRSTLLDIKAYYREQEGSFGLGQQKASDSDTLKIGGDGRYRINDQFAVGGEILHQEAETAQTSRDMISSLLEYKTDQSSYTAGLRFAVDEDISGLKYESTLLTGSARRSFMSDRLDLYTNAELAVGDDTNADYPTRLILGADYALTTAAKVFVAQELTYGENQDNQATRFGIKTTPWQGASLSSSIENQQGENGPRTFANMGLTQGIKISEALRIDFGLEKSETIRHPGDTQLNVKVPPASGAISDDFTAGSAGFTWKEPLWSTTGRAEYRDGEQEDKTGLLFGFYREQSPGIGLSANIRYFDTRRVTGTGSISSELELSFAWRPIDSQWIILDKAELIDNEDETLGNISTTRKYINNLNANYLFDRRNQLAFAHGIKSVTDSFNTIEYDALTQLIGLEYRHDINTKWDIGLQGSTIFTDAGNNSAYSYGISAGHSFAKNIWLSLGFNFTGFEDDDFSGADYTADGAYLKFRVKFDQNTVRDMLAWWEK